MIYRATLLTVLGLIGVGLILNAATYSNMAPVSASGTLPALVTPADYSAGDYAPAELAEIDEITYDHVLAQMHRGQWFGWSDPDNKVYENLIIHDLQYSKPSKAVLDGLIESATSTRTISRDALQARESNRITLETAIASGTETDADIRAYLRLLGDF